MGTGADQCGARQNEIVRLLFALMPQAAVIVAA